MTKKTFQANECEIPAVCAETVALPKVEIEYNDTTAMTVAISSCAARGRPDTKLPKGGLLPKTILPHPRKKSTAVGGEPRL